MEKFNKECFELQSLVQDYLDDYFCSVPDIPKGQLTVKDKNTWGKHTEHLDFQNNKEVSDQVMVIEEENESIKRRIGQADYDKLVKLGLL